MQCTATSKDGTTCRRKAREDTPFCTPHSPNAAGTDRICPTCRIRWRVKRPIDVGWSQMSRNDYRWLEQMAAQFDAESGELFTATDFVAWIRADITAFGRYQVPEMEGRSTVETANKTGTKPTRHGRPDPTPYADLRGLRKAG